MVYSHRIEIPAEFAESNGLSTAMVRQEEAQHNSGLWLAFIKSHCNFTVKDEEGNRLSHCEIISANFLGVNGPKQTCVIEIHFEMKKTKPHKIPQRLIRYKPTIKVEVRTVRCL